MSILKKILEIRPPKHNTSEVFTLRGFECIQCSGNGGHRGGKLAHNEQEHEWEECKLCKGSGKLQAKVVVGWGADDAPPRVLTS